MKAIPVRMSSADGNVIGLRLTAENEHERAAVHLLMGHTDDGDHAGFEIEQSGNGRSVPLELSVRPKIGKRAPDVNADEYVQCTARDALGAVERLIAESGAQCCPY